MVKLGEVFDLQMGKTPSRSNTSYWKDGTNKWVSISDIGLASKYIYETNENISDLAVKETGIKVVPKNTVIMSFKLSIGKACILPEEMYTNEAIMAFINKGKYELDNNYLYHLLRGIDWSAETNKAVMGSTLNKRTLSNFKIPLPPLEVQKHIAKILDATADLIALRKKQLAELDHLAESIFYDMFGDPVTNKKGWEIKRIIDIAKEKLSYGSGASAVEYDGVTRYIRITDINDEGELNSNIVSPSKISKKYILNDGDILFARSGATVGKTFRYKNSFGKCIYAGYLIRLIPNKNMVHPDYVYYFTKTNYYKAFIALNMKTVAQPNINAKQYSELKIPLPPLELQNQFADFVTKIEEQKALVQKALDESQYLFDSLMSKFFE